MFCLKNQVMLEKILKLGYNNQISAFKKIIFQLFKELQDRKVVDNFNVTSVHYLLDKICINTNYLEVICFKNLSQSTLFYLSRSPSFMKAINCHSLLPKTTLKC